MISSVIALLAAAVTSTGDGSAAGAQANPAPAAAPAAAAKDPDTKMVCRYIVPTGQRLGGERVCHTKAEWDELTRRDRDATTESQMKGMQGGAPGGG
jgi:hypothetical protein